MASVAAADKAADAIISIENNHNWDSDTSPVLVDGDGDDGVGGLVGSGKSPDSELTKCRAKYQVGFISVPKSPVLKRACPFKRAFGEYRPFSARFFKILPVFLGFLGHST